MLKPRRKVFYPSSDGEPMADKEIGLVQMVDIRHALRRWFADDPMVYVGTNLLLYYQEGNPKARVAPDVFVARVPKEPMRDTYKLWEEGRPPQVAFEFTSRSSRHLDPNFKVSLYEQLGVEEVYLYDPEGRWIFPRFKVLRRSGGTLQKLDVIGPVLSPALGLELRVEDPWLRLYDPRTGSRLLTPDEEAAAAQREAGRADQAVAKVRALEAELERLRRDRSAD